MDGIKNEKSLILYEMEKDCKQKCKEKKKKEARHEVRPLSKERRAVDAGNGNVSKIHAIGVM